MSGAVRPPEPDEAASGRIARRFAQLRQAGRGALIPFVTGFDPDRATSQALLSGLPGAGADLIEIGMPFSDPMADGPTIQAASRRGLAAGATLAGVLDLVAGFRRTDAATPIVLMGYLNPIESFGPDAFCDAASAAGVDGLIIVDLPPEEADRLAPRAAECGIDLIRLVTPTTDAARLERILLGSSGFLYYVSIAGITGTGTASEAALVDAIPRLRAASPLPVAIGFGIRTPAQAAIAARVADGAVVASALIQTLERTLDSSGRATSGTVETVLAQVRDLARAVCEARVGHAPAVEEMMS